MFQGSFREILRVFQECFKDDSTKIEGCFKFKGCFMEVSMVFKEVSKKFPGIFKSV